jgi:DNA-directed RNA polymerase specialized sigma24 family protein
MIRFLIRLMMISRKAACRAAKYAKWLSRIVASNAARSVNMEAAMRTNPQSNTQCNTPLVVGSAAYRQSVPVVQRDRAEEARIIAAARAGNQAARADLIGLCQARAWSRAVSLAGFYRVLRGVVLDPQDIAQEAMLRAWLRLDKALAAPNPVGYLLRALEGAMLTFCREQQNAIRVPAPAQSRGRRPVEVVSLDAPMSGYDRVTLADLLPAEVTV